MLKAGLTPDIYNNMEIWEVTAWSIGYRQRQQVFWDNLGNMFCSGPAANKRRATQ